LQKSNLTSNGITGLLERIIRGIPLIYFLIRNLAVKFNLYENDFYLLKKIFYNKKINIIDIGASDGLSSVFFLKHLNTNRIICYEPNYELFTKLKKIFKNSNADLYNYGLGYKNKKIKLYYPYIKIFGKKKILLTYSFPKKEDLIEQIKKDFLIKPLICSKYIKIKKFKFVKERIHLIKIDTNGSELNIIKQILPLIKRDKPVIFIENYEINKIKKILIKLKYTRLKSKNKKNLNIIFKTTGI